MFEKYLRTNANFDFKERFVRERPKCGRKLQRVFITDGYGSPDEKRKNLVLISDRVVEGGGL